MDIYIHILGTINIRIYIYTRSYTHIICLWNREREPQILDYQTQQYKLFPVIAMILVYKSAATWLWDEYNTVTSELERGDLEHLPEVNTYSTTIHLINISIIYL